MARGRSTLVHHVVYWLSMLEIATLPGTNLCRNTSDGECDITSQSVDRIYKSVAPEHY